jgi:heptosyltransferase-1
MEKILIIKTSALGDIVHTYPTISYLRAKFPQAQIDWVVEAPFAGLVASHPSVNHAIPVSTKAWRKAPLKKETWQDIFSFRERLREIDYDVVFDLQGNVKSGLILAQVNSPQKIGFASKTVPEWPNLLFTNKRYNPINDNIRQDYLGLVASFFGEELPNKTDKIQLKISDAQREILVSTVKQLPQEGPKVVVCPGSAWRNKQLTPETLEAFLALVQKLMNCSFLFIWGSSEERDIAQQLNRRFAKHSVIVDKMSLPMLQNLMDMSDLVVAMDSLPLHLAGTTSTPSYSVFGASSAKKYKPLGQDHGAFQGICPYGRTFVKRCPILRTCKTGACIRSLAANDLYAHFHSWWIHR